MTDQQALIVYVSGAQLVELLYRSERYLPSLVRAADRDNGVLGAILRGRVYVWVRKADDAHLSITDAALAALLEHAS